MRVTSTGGERTRCSASTERASQLYLGSHKHLQRRLVAQAVGVGSAWQTYPPTQTISDGGGSGCTNVWCDLSDLRKIASTLVPVPNIELQWWISLIMARARRTPVESVSLDILLDHLRLPAISAMPSPVDHQSAFLNASHRGVAHPTAALTELDHLQSEDRFFEHC